MSKRIGLDLDGVVFDFNTHFVNLARNRYPERNIPSPSNDWPTHWDYIRPYLERYEENDLWKTIKTSDFWATCSPYPHAYDLVKAADTLADELYFVTSRPCSATTQAQSKLAIDNIYHTHGATIIVRRPEDKAPLIKALRLDFYVDDKKETVRDVLEQCPLTRVAVWDQPWNREWNFPTRLYNVEQFHTWASY